MTTKTERKDLFAFMLERVKDTAKQYTLKDPQAFGRWFLNMYFRDPHGVIIPDGPKTAR